MDWSKHIYNNFFDNIFAIYNGLIDTFFYMFQIMFVILSRPILKSCVRPCQSPFVVPCLQHLLLNRCIWKYLYTCKCILDVNWNLWYSPNLPFMLGCTKFMSEGWEVVRLKTDLNHEYPEKEFCFFETHKHTLTFWNCLPVFNWLD